MFGEKNLCTEGKMGERFKKKKRVTVLDMQFKERNTNSRI